MVVLKDAYVKNFIEELIVCAILLIFALDVRFRIFSWLKNKAAKIIGWIFRIAFIAAAAVILFLCGRVVVGSLINTSGPAKYVVVLGMALENGAPTKDLLLGSKRPDNIWRKTRTRF